jgi:sulfide:quinone oxidoreductase
MTLEINRIHDNFCATGQMTLESLAEAAELGFKTIFNYRPDGEGGAEQPTSAELKAKAEQLGLNYFHIPVVPGNLQPEQVQEFIDLYANAANPALVYCRGGTRDSKVFELANVESA